MICGSGGEAVFWGQRGVWVADSAVGWGDRGSRLLRAVPQKLTIKSGDCPHQPISPPRSPPPGEPRFGGSGAVPDLPPISPISPDLPRSPPSPISPPISPCHRPAASLRRRPVFRARVRRSVSVVSCRCGAGGRTGSLPDMDRLDMDKRSFPTLVGEVGFARDRPQGGRSWGPPLPPNDRRRRSFANKQILGRAGTTVLEGPAYANQAT